MHLITDLRESFSVSWAYLYTNSIKKAGAPVDSCVSFIDCANIRMCRPNGHGNIQRSFYSGHKPCHCIIHQTITTPDGFVLQSPEVWSRHDLNLFREKAVSETTHRTALILTEGSSIVSVMQQICSNPGSKLRLKVLVQLGGEKCMKIS